MDANLPAWQEQMLAALLKNDLMTASEIKELYIPRKVYRYMDLSLKALVELNRNEMPLSKPKWFNDPYDSGITIIDGAEDSSDEFWDKWLVENGYDKHLYGHESMTIKKSEDRIYELEKVLMRKSLRSEEMKPLYDLKGKIDGEIWRLNQELKESVKIKCFSERNDSMLMWSHYAQNHKGICVEYDLSPTRVVDKIYRDNMFPVIYSKTIFDAGKLRDHKYLPIIAALYKNTDWSYEMEWRFIEYQAPSMNTIELPVTAIYFGERFNTDELDVYVDFLKRKNVPCFYMMNDRRSFVLRPVRLIDYGL